MKRRELKFMTPQKVELEGTQEGGWLLLCFIVFALRYMHETLATKRATKAKSSSSLPASSFNLRTGEKGGLEIWVVSS